LVISSYLSFLISSFASYFENILIIDNSDLVIILIMDEERVIGEMDE